MRISLLLLVGIQQDCKRPLSRLLATQLKKIMVEIFHVRTWVLSNYQERVLDKM